MRFCCTEKPHHQRQWWQNLRLNRSKHQILCEFPRINANNFKQLGNLFVDGHVHTRTFFSRRYTFLVFPLTSIKMLSIIPWAVFSSSPIFRYVPPAFSTVCRRQNSRSGKKENPSILIWNGRDVLLLRYVNCYFPFQLLLQSI